MTSKIFVLRLLDGIFIGFSMVLIMGVAGLPMDWVLNLLDMSSPEFTAFGSFVLSQHRIRRHEEMAPNHHRAVADPALCGVDAP